MTIAVVAGSQGDLIVFLELTEPHSNNVGGPSL